MKSYIRGKADITINAAAEKVWDALTQPEVIRQYFFGTNASTTWEVNSPITFKGEWEGKPYSDKGTVLAFEPYKLIRYTYWSSISGIEDKPENYVVITYKLMEDDGKTHLTITQENIPDEKMKEHSEQNWSKVLHELKNLLEKPEVIHL